MDVKLGGRAVLATGFLPASHWAFVAPPDTYDHDPARASDHGDEFPATAEGTAVVIGVLTLLANGALNDGAQTVLPE